ncbi:MAG: VOC family protein [Pseudomonadales bacterium]|jgi:hypothetical protein|nr:VOC family protein [Pseudomonadales bacterium]
MIQRTLFVRAVPDLAASAACYAAVLGFDVEEMGDSGWRKYSRDQCRIMAGACPDAIKLGDHACFGYLVVDDAKGHFDDVSARGPRKSSSRCTTSPGT